MAMDTCRAVRKTLIQTADFGPPSRNDKELTTERNSNELIGIFHLAFHHIRFILYYYYYYGLLTNTTNSLSISQITFNSLFFFREFTLNLLSILRFHYDFTTFVANPL